LNLFHRQDWTLFRNLQTIGQKAGVRPEKIPRLVAKELVDNALDAGGSCRFKSLEDGRFHVKDDGPGLPGTDEEIAALFSVARPLTSSKLLRLPTRGALGNGLRVVAGAVLATGGELVVKTRGRSLRLTPRDTDGETDITRLGGWRGQGTRVEVRLGPALSVDDGLSTWANRALLFATAGGGKVYRGRTSPWWYDSDSFFELVQAAGNRTVRDLVQDFEGCSGRKAGAAASGFKNRQCRSLRRNETDDLLKELQASSTPVKPQRLGFVGQEVPGLEDHEYAKTTGTFKAKAARGRLHATIPFVIEAWANEATESAVLVHVNRTPITADVWPVQLADNTCHGLAGCGLSDEKAQTAAAVKVGRDRHFRFVVNIITPYMPITTDGKEPNLRVVRDELTEAMAKAARKAKRKSPGGSARVTQKESIIECLPAAIAKVSGGGRYRYALRRLFYAVRPRFLEVFGKEPNYDTFGQIITGHEAELGHDLEGIYRDNRGTLYHPHLREEIHLGTRSVEEYERPAWIFNKILYVEKEGLYPMLIDAQWPERHDCALLTSKGFASRAARDALDLLGETDEDLTFFCIQDADGYGTIIYQSLTEATRARPGRRVHVVNLGLEPEEALGMDLPVEEFEPKKRAVPVAEYVSDEWREWFQTHRVELDAMEPDEFLAWLDRKLLGYEGKLVPAGPVIEERVEKQLRDGLRKRLAEEAIRAARVDERVDAAVDDVLSRLVESDTELDATVREDLEQEPAHHWTNPVDHLAQGLIEDHFEESA
jgi:hypothetical protein